MRRTLIYHGLPRSVAHGQTLARANGGGDRGSGRSDTSVRGGTQNGTSQERAERQRTRGGGSGPRWRRIRAKMEAAQHPQPERCSAPVLPAEEEQSAANMDTSTEQLCERTAPEDKCGRNCDWTDMKEGLPGGRTAGRGPRGSRPPPAA